MSFTVAIDGPAAAGKGTISKAVAAHFGFAHLDTGLLYRAVGRKTLGLETLSETTAAQLAAELTPTDLERDDLRTVEVAQAASRVAALPAVRQELLAFQRAFSKRPMGAVLDGRDIGTVICPDADVKLFVTASDEIRARRRYEELKNKGGRDSLAHVMAALKQRDANDAARDVAPMEQAADAILLDTTNMVIDVAVQSAISVIKKRMQDQG
ncbi:cytidylate kinase [Amylibacter marinus]|uniref:Cytidylate kinase n=1 Tax=Amylibacter marinus TaxID=1475483 RepID=A0ABQ5VQS1_9RHOB|nr:(d)CMP kinase [Amylibacter marinus]GLQ33751.1 cytidylate kinase [Amylibacter marinus]